MKERLIRFMSGRYGADQLSRFMLGVCFVCLILNLFTGTYLLYVLALALLAVCYFRMFSRNIQKRYAENQKYLQLTGGIRRKWAVFLRDWKDRKTHRIYKCPGCGQKIRIPKGHGRVEIRCPKCRTQFVRKS